MTPLQKLQIEQSETRSKIADHLTRDETTADDIAELDKLTARMKELEPLIRAALIVEPEPVETRADATPEDREFADLIKRSSVADFIGESLGEPIDGASLELRQALALGGNSFPIDLLETRADVATNVTASVQESQGSIADRVFARSAGAYLGVSRPTVGIGESTYVALSTGATGDVRSDGVAKDADAANFTSKTVAPVRATARYLVGVESTVRLRGLEDALRRDLVTALSDKLDALAINGQAAVANVSPVVEGVLSNTTEPADPGNSAIADDFLDAYLDRVDGIYAYDENSVRVLVNADSFRHARKLRESTGGPLLDELPDGRFRVSANLPATASTIARGISYTAGRTGLVQPVWRSASIIRDPYTHAASGQIALTIVLLTGAAMVDAGAFAQLKFKVA